jgi:hypothetical protein
MLDTYTSIYKPRHSNKKSKTEEFVKKAILIHGDNYDYSKVEYKNAHGKVKIFCPIHGDFEQVAYSHLNGHGCCKCKNVAIGIRTASSTRQFIQRSILVHGDKYDYSKVDYKTAHGKLTIICPIHGEFEQIAYYHSQGSGCPKCANDETRVRNRIRNTIKFENTYDVATIYLLKCFNGTETFLKIGITSRTIEKRYKTKKSMPYEYETLYQWTGDSKTVVDTEYKIKTKFTYHKPEIMFAGGYTETLHISQEKSVLESLYSSRPLLNPLSYEVCNSLST